MSKSYERLEVQCEELAGILADLGLPHNPLEYSEEFTAFIRNAAVQYRALMRGDVLQPDARDFENLKYAVTDPSPERMASVEAIARAGYVITAFDTTDITANNMRALSWDAETEMFLSGRDKFDSVTGYCWSRLFGNWKEKAVSYHKPASVKPVSFEAGVTIGANPMLETLKIIYPRNGMKAARGVSQRVLNYAVRRGYIRRVGEGYRITRQGIAALMAHDLMSAEEGAELWAKA